MFTKVKNRKKRNGNLYFLSSTSFFVCKFSPKFFSRACGFGGLYEPVSWNYASGSFSASLLELTFGSKLFYFWKENPSPVATRYKHLLFTLIFPRRLHDGILVIDSVSPFQHHTSGMSFTFSPQCLDVPENGTHAFVKVTNSLGQVICQTVPTSISPWTSSQRPGTAGLASALQKSTKNFLRDYFNGFL